MIMRRAVSEQRALHAKATLAVDDAVLRFNDDLPADLQVGFAMPGQTYLAKVRFSNAANSGQPDFAKDLRGIAIRIHADDRTSVGGGNAAQTRRTQSKLRQAIRKPLRGFKG